MDDVLPLKYRLAKYWQIELHVALEHTKSEKRAEHEKALSTIEEEENQARDRCKVISPLVNSLD